MNYPVSIHVELAKDDLVHGLAEAGPRAFIERLRVGEQLKRSRQEGVTDIEPARGVAELLLNAGALGRDRVEFPAQLLLRPARRADEIKVLVLLGIERLQLPPEPLLEVRQTLPLGKHGVSQLAAYSAQKLVRKPDGGVVLDDESLEDLDSDIGQVAAMRLTTATQEVEVLAAVPLARHDDEPLFTASTPEHTFEVVVMGPLPRSTTPETQHFLHSVEDLRRHQSLMPTGVLLSLVLNDAKVVAVLQHLIQLA